MISARRGHTRLRTFEYINNFVFGFRQRCYRWIRNRQIYVEQQIAVPGRTRLSLLLLLDFGLGISFQADASGGNDPGVTGRKGPYCN